MCDEFFQQDLAQPNVPDVLTDIYHRHRGHANH
jgi:hypothetical protein